MSWRELIEQLQMTIPEDRMDEQAIFFNREEETGDEIDSIEKISLECGAFWCTAGNDTDTYVISL